MEAYTLKENEVILFRGMVALLSDGREEKNTDTYNTELILTNLNIVLNSIVKKMFTQKIEQKIFSANDIKIYDETVQVIRKKTVVDVYFLGGELFLKFEKEKDAKEFCDKAIKLKDGNSKFVRSVKKTKKAIKETNEALDIDIVQIAKTTASVACEVAIGVASVKNASKGAQMVAKIAEVFHTNAKRNEKEKLLIGSSNNNPSLYDDKEGEEKKNI